MTDEELAQQFACTMNSEDRVFDWLTPFLAALATVRTEATQAEREACLAIAQNSMPKPGEGLRLNIVNAIQARGEVK